jgi:hypothetical protein
MSYDGLRNGIVLVYMVGNVLTFNSLLKAERAAMVAGDAWLPIIVKLLSCSLVWPIYWLTRIFT